MAEKPYYCGLWFDISHMVVNLVTIIEEQNYF